MSSASVQKTAHDALLAKYSAVYLSGYSCCTSLEEQEVYRDLLSQMAETVARPQTPLVNAGYAVRVHCVLEGVKRFLQYYSTSSHDNTPIHIIVMGAGMDVTGLWAASLSATPVHVVEVDCRPVCAVKKEKLLSKKLIVETTEQQDDKDDTFLIRRARIPRSSNPSSTFTLVAANLGNVAQVQSVLLECSPKIINVEESSRPTLFLFELVLSYLGTSAVRSLLRWCQEQCFTSAVLAYEALAGGAPSRNSTLQRYRQMYVDSFATKLQKGMSNNVTTIGEESSSRSTNTSFTPVGSSCQELEKTWKSDCGFANVYATTAGHAASSYCEGCCIETPELFDEHAALVLHLQSYAVVWAFVEKGNPLQTHWLCPWISQASLCRRLDDESSTWLTVVEVEDEDQVISLYQESYRDVMEKHSSIRKMVETSLQRELAKSSKSETFSSMRRAYRSQGGDFFVVIDLQRDGRRDVLGGMALRSCTAKEQVSFHDGGTSAVSSKPRQYYEIQRFFVKNSRRRSGLGAALLCSALEWIRRKSPNSRIALKATTPSVLEAANRFYRSHGFELVQSEEQRDLLMHTYVLAQSAQQTSSSFSTDR